MLTSYFLPPFFIHYFEANRVIVIVNYKSTAMEFDRFAIAHLILVIIMPLYYFQDIFVKMCIHMYQYKFNNLIWIWRHYNKVIKNYILEFVDIKTVILFFLYNENVFTWIWLQITIYINIVIANSNKNGF